MSARDRVTLYDDSPSFSDQAFALRIEDDAMVSSLIGEPSFPPGTIIIAGPQRSAAAGDFVIAKDKEAKRATFRMLTTDGTRWFLKPLNPAYPTIEIDDPASRIVGRVVESQLRRQF